MDAIPPYLLFGCRKPRTLKQEYTAMSWLTLTHRGSPARYRHYRRPLGIEDGTTTIIGMLRKRCLAQNEATQLQAAPSLVIQNVDIECQFGTSAAPDPCPASRRKAFESECFAQYKREESLRASVVQASYRLKATIQNPRMKFPLRAIGRVLKLNQNFVGPDIYRFYRLK
ncbi:hypothetical protein N5K13_29795 [Sphingobium yanoikuyae]|nr:hypothetical protein [Sphingobium yanoikuyae]MDH2170691.1 hypothetical protein [Sphingobium yanoikuyae]